MNADEIKRFIVESCEVKQLALIKRNNKRSIIEEEYQKSIKDNEDRKKMILVDLGIRAWELVKDDAPYNRGGERIRFDESGLNENGLWVRWDADHPNDIVSITLSFEELCK